MTTTDKQPRKKTVKKNEKPPEPVPQPEPVVEESKPPQVVETPVEDPVGELMTMLTNLKSTVASMIEQVKKIQKGKKRKSNGNQKSGFVKQVPISKELACFMGLKNNELVSRVDVTKFLTEYVKTKELQVPESKQFFKIDQALSKLFSMNVGEQVHYFKLQTHLKRHYPKQEVVA